jgi:hypothetical protein
MGVPGTHQWFGYPSLALVMFLLAIALGFYLVLGILLSDRKAKDRAEKDPL